MKKLYKVVIMTKYTDDNTVWAQFIECESYKELVEYISHSDCKNIYHENVTGEYITCPVDRLVDGEMIYHN